MNHNFAVDECNNVNNCVVKDMWVVGTKIIPESWASQSKMTVRVTWLLLWLLGNVLNNRERIYTVIY